MQSRSHRRSDARMEFGKGFGSYYSGWNDFIQEYPKEDREQYPALFELPEGVYEVKIMKPLGIAFVEGDNVRVGMPDGVVVDYLVEGGNAEKDGRIKPGDVLLATTACMGRDGKFERKVIPSRYLDFDTIMNAIGSNEAKFNKERKNDAIIDVYFTQGVGGVGCLLVAQQISDTSDGGVVISCNFQKF